MMVERIMKVVTNISGRTPPIHFRQTIAQGTP